MPDPALLLLGLVFLLLAAAAFFLLLRNRGQGATIAAAERQLQDLRQTAEGLAERLRVAEAERAGAAARAEHLTPLEPRLRVAEETIATLNAEIARRDSRAAADAEAHSKRIADLTQLRGEMEKDFKNLASAALGENRQSFLSLADEVFKKHRAEANADVEARKKAVDDLVRPIGETLQQTRAKLEQIEKERDDAFGQIRQQLAGVGHEAARLTQALRANPGTRGRWGEESLRNALELAGLSVHCDFEMQATFAGVESNLRPDCVIRLPGGRHIVVDAKSPLSAYLDGIEATDEATRTACMKRHADSIRQHMLSLTRRDYAQAVSAHLSARPDFVAMYVPGENFFAAAIERNGELFSEAIAKGVFIVTPTTLIALAKVIALNWRQEAIEQNAREIAALGRELYVRLCRVGDHVTKLGRELKSSTAAYNQFVGSLENSVLPQARRFRDLGAADSSKTIEFIAPLDVEIREPLEGRDLFFEDPRLALPEAPERAR